PSASPAAPAAKAAEVPDAGTTLKSPTEKPEEAKLNGAETKPEEKTADTEDEKINGETKVEDSVEDKDQGEKPEVAADAINKDDDSKGDAQKSGEMSDEHPAADGKKGMDLGGSDEVWSEPVKDQEERTIRQAVLKVAEEYFRAACQLIRAPPVRSSSAFGGLDLPPKDTRRGKKKPALKGQEAKLARERERERELEREREREKEEKVKDPEVQAIEYLEIAVSLGHGRATDYLGCCYAKGLHGLEKNEQKALQLVMKASEI
ncbi:hypothetical protein HDU93_006554, partial [Gonapodya sp. JEL0774]